jgi:outer membrane protein assembly factor BamB
MITCVPGIVFSENSPTRTTSSTEWPEPYGNQENTGRSFSNLPTDKVVSWSKIRVDNFYSQPLIDDGTLVLLQDKVYAYDAETGDEKWTYPL